jgi:uncharacterized phage-associated protein
MTYPANLIAKAIIERSNPEYGDVITNLKLQKLLYYCQGFYLALNKKTPLFDEDIVAWQYGPVVPEIYHQYKDAGSQVILPSQEKVDLDNNTIELIDEVYKVYGQFSAIKLMEMTHEESPWKETPIRGVISKDLMFDYFSGLANTN